MPTLAALIRARAPIIIMAGDTRLSRLGAGRRRFPLLGADRGPADAPGPAARAAFRAWFDAFLPDLAAGAPRSLFTPAFVSDRSDGKIAHLDGVNLSRAWCWRGLADALDPDARRRSPARTADAHLDASLPHVAGDYMGEHWLATFALLALEGRTDRNRKG